MHAHRRPAKLAAWIAIFAILLAALAPGLARALASPQPMPWSEICSLGGPQAAQDQLPASGSGQHQGAAVHCPFCLTHGGHVALPAAPFAGLPAVAVGAAPLPSACATPPPRFIRVAAQPRAPPVHS